MAQRVGECFYNTSEASIWLLSLAEAYDAVLYKGAREEAVRRKDSKKLNDNGFYFLACTGKTFRGKV